MMYCTNCGKQMDEGAQCCPNCGAPTQQAPNQAYYSQQGGQMPYGMPFMVPPELESRWTKLLIFSILEMMCCNTPFGVIALVFAILAKSALSKGNVAEFESKSKIAKNILIAGVIIGVILVVAYIAFISLGVLTAVF